MGEAGKSYQYDAIQRNVVGNHIALVPNARAGRQATFLDSEGLDSDTIILDSQTIIHQQNSIESSIENNMKYLVKHNDMEMELEGKDSKHVMDMINSMKENMKDMETKLSDMQAKHSEMCDKYEAMSKDMEGKEKEMDGYKGKIDGLEAQLAEAQSQPKLDADVIASEVKARAAVWAKIAPHLDCEADYSLSVIDAQKLYLKSAMPNLAEKIDSADESYINGLWDVKQPTEKTVKSDATEAVVFESGTKFAKNDADLGGISDAEKEALSNFYS